MRGTVKRGNLVSGVTIAFTSLDYAESHKMTVRSNYGINTGTYISIGAERKKRSIFNAWDMKMSSEEYRKKHVLVIFT